MVHDKTLVHGKNIMYYAIQKQHSLSWHQQLTSELSELFWLRYVIIIITNKRHPCLRNGPAQISFGSSRRILTSWLEGFAKLHSFKELLTALIIGHFLLITVYILGVEQWCRCQGATYCSVAPCCSPPTTWPALLPGSSCP